jgi:spermidine synthase
MTAISFADTTEQVPRQAAAAVPAGLFAATIFVSAFLLFWMQPLFSKMVLPLLGGSPSVWNTAMMFFQLVLLAGYGYAHLLTRIAKLRWQFLIHILIVCAGLAFLPFAAPRILVPPSHSSPIFWLVGILALSVGWPFFVLSASAPLMQAWFARSRHRLSGDPYFLYTTSNLGSLIALLSFPVLLEPQLTLTRQAAAWATGYDVLLVLLVLIAAGVLLLGADKEAEASAAGAATIVPASPWRDRLIWIALAFVPSSLLLGLTTYITTDIASAPLFWVIPLALYLLSFIIAFARSSWLKPEWMLKAQAMGIVAVCILQTLVLVFGLGGSVPLAAGVHLAAFFATAVVCHSELARRRPAAENLTIFYFCMSIGGAAGGIFNALIAPVIFSSDYEYYLALAAACALRGFAERKRKILQAGDLVYPLLLGLTTVAVAYFTLEAGPPALIARMALLLAVATVLYSFVERPVRFALGIAALFAGGLAVQGMANVLHTERNFFGIDKIKLTDDGHKTALIHGTTMHGTEFVDPALQREPLAYYARSGPVGQMFALAPTLPSVAAVGLGTGALACYRRPGESWTFLEIDNAVERIARDGHYFHYLSECKAGTKVVIGDGRLLLNAERDHSYDLIIVDAFSSDSIPMHLLTREALALYLRKLKPHGIVLFNVSNEYLSIEPVLATLIQDAHAAGRHELFFPTAKQVADGATASEWMIIAAKEADLKFLSPERRWHPLEPQRSDKPWSDDFSNILGAVRW